MKELDLNQSTLAAKIGCAHRKINEIVNGKRGISADFAIDLERTLGTSAEMWMNMQASHDLWVARQKRKKAA
jgi:addiction module HigA family antidote